MSDTWLLQWPTKINKHKNNPTEQKSKTQLSTAQKTITQNKAVKFKSFS